MTSSYVTFSSCSPSAALVAGVKIGLGSSDPDGHLPLSYGWAQVGGTPITLSNPAASQPTFTAPVSPAVLTFTLTVTDSTGLVDSTPDLVVVTVSDQAITGLAADNSSPTTLGGATALTATVTGGSGISYAWGFGELLEQAYAVINSVVNEAPAIPYSDLRDASPSSWNPELPRHVSAMDNQMYNHEVIKKLLLERD